MFNFVNKDPQDIIDNIIGLFEKISGEKLYPGDPRKQFLLTLANIIIQQRVVIDQACKANLLRFAQGNSLDELGKFSNVIRLEDTAATTILKFVISKILGIRVIIKKGTRVTPDGSLFFSTDEEVVIEPGSTFVEVKATCLSKGNIGNDFLVGQINNIVDGFPYFKSVSNTTISGGGNEVESDDIYRDRIRNSPESFSTAGPEGGYKYWAKTADTNIIDVAVYSVNPGEVTIKPLLNNGVLPSEEVISKVYSICNDKRIRPLTDKVIVTTPRVINYDLDVTYYIHNSNSAQKDEISSKVNDAIADYIKWQKSKLGLNINPSRLIANVINEGALRVEVNSPVYKVIDNDQVAIEDNVNIKFGGFEDD